MEDKFATYDWFLKKKKRKETKTQTFLSTIHSLSCSFTVKNSDWIKKDYIYTTILVTLTQNSEYALLRPLTFLFRDHTRLLRSPGSKKTNANGNTFFADISASYDLIFLDRNTTNFVELNTSLPDLSAFTVCFWYRAWARQLVFLSYATGNMTDAIMMFLSETGLFRFLVLNKQTWVNNDFHYLISKTIFGETQYPSPLLATEYQMEGLG